MGFTHSDHRTEGVVDIGNTRIFRVCAFLLLAYQKAGMLARFFQNGLWGKHETKTARIKFLHYDVGPPR